MYSRQLVALKPCLQNLLSYRTSIKCVIDLYRHTQFGMLFGYSLQVSWGQRHHRMLDLPLNLGLLKLWMFWLPVEHMALDQALIQISYYLR